jgi:hypothetical protein
MSAHSRQTSEPDRITRPQPAEVRKETYDSLDSLMEGILPEDIFFQTTNNRPLNGTTPASRQLLRSVKGIIPVSQMDCHTVFGIFIEIQGGFQECQRF